LWQIDSAHVSIRGHDLDFVHHSMAQREVRWGCRYAHQEHCSAFSRREERLCWYLQRARGVDRYVNPLAESIVVNGCDWIGGLPVDQHGCAQPFRVLQSFVLYIDDDDAYCASGLRHHGRKEQASYTAHAKEGNCLARRDATPQERVEGYRAGLGHGCRLVGASIGNRLAHLCRKCRAFGKPTMGMNAEEEVMFTDVAPSLLAWQALAAPPSCTGNYPLANLEPCNIRALVDDDPHHLMTKDQRGALLTDRVGVKERNHRCLLILAGVCPAQRSHRHLEQYLSWPRSPRFGDLLDSHIAGAVIHCSFHCTISLRIARLPRPIVPAAVPASTTTSRSSWSDER